MNIWHKRKGVFKIAQRRMFSLSIVDTDLFLEMPVTSRLLYYELGMRADDDGFVDNWKKIMRMTGLSEDDMKILIAKKFILVFESGVIVIRHWRLNNYLRNDRRTPTRHKKELEQLYLEDDVYELESTEKSTLLPDGIPVDDTGKDRLGKYIPPITPQGDDEGVEDDSIQIQQIVDYLNKQTGCSYKASTDETRKKIKARLKEGFAVEDFEKVIDSRVADWGNDLEMQKYLRPSTLFGTKFESYLQHAKRVENSSQELGYNVE